MSPPSRARSRTGAPPAAWSGLICRRRCASEIEQRCGSPVVSAASQGGGFTPGFASVLTCADGSRHFVKAASTAAQRPFAASYREEARKLRALPDTIPAPRLLWTMDGDWVVLGLEYVEARAPRRPWRMPELNACLDTLETVADLLTPAPPGLELDPITDELAAWPAFWEHVNATRDLAHGDDAAALAAGFAESARRRHPGPHRRARRQRAAGGRRPHPVLRLELADDRRGLARLAVHADRPARRRARRGGGDRRAAPAARRTAGRPGPRARRHLRLLPPLGRRAGAPDLALRPRRPALAGRGGLGLALRAPRLDA